MSLSVVLKVGLVGFVFLFVLHAPSDHAALKYLRLRRLLESSFTTLLEGEEISRRRLETSRDVGHKFPAASRGVVILPGPHKTGSSSVQKNMVMWTRSKVLNGWVWPLITERLRGKNFLRLVTSFRKGARQIQEEYARLFQDAWKKGENIVFGSELMDVVTMDPENRIINGLLDMMPWNRDPTLYGSNDLITVSVTYRSPRAEHLISVWHQKGKPGVSLSEFISTLEPESRQWHASLNPLGVADHFARNGLSTVIIDLSGLRHENLDLSMVLACEVLHASCQNNTIAGLNEAPAVKNVKFGRGEMDLDEQTLNEIEKVLKLMDARYCHLARKANVKVLHGLDIFSFCKDETLNKGAISTHEAARRIKDIVAAATQST